MRKVFPFSRMCSQNSRCINMAAVPEKWLQFTYFSLLFLQFGTPNVGYVPPYHIHVNFWNLRGVGNFFPTFQAKKISDEKKVENARSFGSY